VYEKSFSDGIKSNFVRYPKVHEWREINWANIKHESGTALRHVNCQCDLFFECLKALWFLFDKFYLYRNCASRLWLSFFMSNAWGKEEDFEKLFYDCLPLAVSGFVSRYKFCCSWEMLQKNTFGILRGN
jgi:hypothetical protein